MSPDIFLDDVAADADYRIADDEPDLVVEHIPSGSQFKYSEANARWELVGDLDLGGGNLSSVGSLDAEILNNVRQASPGEIQTKVDAAASDGPLATNSIALEPGQTFDPSSPIRVPSNVLVNCRRAFFDLSSDIDVFQLEPGAILLFPKIRVGNVTGYSSSVFKLRSSYGTYENRYTGTIGAEVLGTTGEGTAYDLKDDNGGGISFFRAAQTHVERIGTAISLDGGASGGFTTGNIFEGEWVGADTAIATLGTDLVSKNIVRGQLQPSSSSTRAWDVQNGRNNRFQGISWDTGRYTAEAMRVGAGAGSNNWMEQLVRAGTVTDNKGDPTNHIRRWGDGGFPPQNLSGVTGNWTGQILVDDGTNVSTAGPLPCLWTGSAWQPSDGGATFT